MTAMPIVQNVSPFAKRVATFLAKWHAAKWDPEQGELSDCGHGEYGEGPYWSHGWWMTPLDWSLGVSVATDEWAERFQVSLTIELGPFAWALSVAPLGAMR